MKSWKAKRVGNEALANGKRTGTYIPGVLPWKSVRRQGEAGHSPLYGHIRVSKLLFSAY